MNRPTAEQLKEWRDKWCCPCRHCAGDAAHMIFLEIDSLQSDLAQITLERDQLREQCAYNQLQLEAMAAKLAKADRMDQ